MLQGHSRWVTRGTPGSRLPGPVTMQYVYTVSYIENKLHTVYSMLYKPTLKNSKKLNVIHISMNIVASTFKSANCQL